MSRVVIEAAMNGKRDQVCAGIVRGLMRSESVPASGAVFSSAARVPTALILLLVWSLCPPKLAEVAHALVNGLVDRCLPFVNALALLWNSVKLSCLECQCCRDSMRVPCAVQLCRCCSRGAMISLNNVLASGIMTHVLST